MLSNAYFLAKFRFDTAENEPVSDAAVLDGGGGPPPRAPVATAPAAAGWLVRIKKPCRALLHRLAVQSLFFFFDSDSFSTIFPLQFAFISSINSKQALPIANCATSALPLAPAYPLQPRFLSFDLQSLFLISV